MSKFHEEYEPTPEEWAEIEETILEEEKEEIAEAKEEDRLELNILKEWLRENGMLWDFKDVPNIKR